MTLGTRNDSTIRQYRPSIGKLIKMSEWSDYTSRGLDPWSWLRVIGIDRDTVTVRNASHPSDPSKDTEQLTIPLYTVQVPIGWEPRYTVYCKPEDVDKVLGWFSRGVVNRANHDIGSSRGPVWQPMDNASTPHWAYPDVTDAILPEDCPRLLRIVKVETEEIGSFGPKHDCPYCQGTGRDSVARVNQVRRQFTTETIDETRAYLRSNSGRTYEIHENDTFPCGCGTYMRDIGRTKRAKVIKDMESEGWTVRYHNFDGGYWERQRETTVHDWE